MRLTKIIILSLLFGASIFGLAMATEDIPEAVSGVGGGMSPRDGSGSESARNTAVVEKEKQEADDEDSSSSSCKDQAEDIKLDRQPRTKSELFQCLVGAQSLSSGRFFLSEFDKVLMLTKQGRANSIANLERKVTSVGLNKVLADAGEAYGRIHNGYKGIVQSGQLKAQYEPGDIFKIAQNLYLLHQTLLLAVKRDPSVTIEDLLTLEVDELTTLKSVLELFEEMSFLMTTLNNDEFKAEADSEEPSVMHSAVDKAGVLKATQGQVFDRSLMRKITKSSVDGGLVE